MRTEAPGKAWHPIEGLPDDAHTWRNEPYDRTREEWREVKAALARRGTDRYALEQWLLEQRRAFAIENGQIEQLYTLRRGVTEQLIVEGLECVRGAHTIEGVLEDETLQGLLMDQEAALEMTFALVSGERPLGHSSLKEMHHLLTRHQAGAPGIDSRGRRVQIDLLRGEYKIRPNNPRREDGLIHEYCPPEQVRSEMDRLFEMYEGFKAKPLPTEVRAAWLHHRYMQIHPFQDGNGRTGRLLMAYEFARNHEFAPIIAAAEKPTYLDMMQAGDEGIGGVRKLADYFAGKSAAQTRSAIVRAREVLRGRGAERKAERARAGEAQRAAGVHRPGRQRPRRRRRAAPGGERGPTRGPRRFVRREAARRKTADAAKAEGREWVERAARGGDARGAVAAGDACRTGAGGPRDLEAAVEYYEMAVSSENVAEAPGTRGPGGPGCAGSDRGGGTRFPIEGARGAVEGAPVNRPATGGQRTGTPERPSGRSRAGSAGRGYPIMQVSGAFPAPAASDWLGGVPEGRRPATPQAPPADVAVVPATRGARRDPPPAASRTTGSSEAPAGRWDRLRASVRRSCSRDLPP